LDHGGEDKGIRQKGGKAEGQIGGRAKGSPL